MDDSEASVSMLRTELRSAAAQLGRETGAWKQQVPVVLGLGVSRSTGIKKKDRKLQGSWLALVPPVMPAKIGCCLLITVLTAAVVWLSVALSVRNPEQVIETPVYATCPRNWIGFGTKCFYFSEDMRNWTHSHASCVELEAQLAQFDSLEELNVLMRYKGAPAHWIGLCRESSEQPWKWTDSTEYKNTVPIRGEGECAYLNDNGISSARKYIERKWICRKPSNYTVQYPIDA